MKDLQSLELQAFYSLFFNRHGELFKKKIVPFLVSVPLEYDDYLLKVMLYNGTGFSDWGHEIRNSLSLDFLMSLHVYYMENRMSNNYYWDYYHTLVSKTEETLIKEAICWIPNTLNKFSVQGKTTPKEVASYNNAMLKSELKILAPDILVIMSNPNNSKCSMIIEEVVGEYESVPTKIERVYRLKFKDNEILCLRVDSAAYQEVTQTKQQIQNYILEFVFDQIKKRYSQS